MAVKRKKASLMSGKMMQCCEPHVLMHSVLGIGAGIVLVSLIPALGNIWLGVLVLSIGILLDMMRV